MVFSTGDQKYHTPYHVCSLYRVAHQQPYRPAQKDDAAGPSREQDLALYLHGVLVKLKRSGVDIQVL